MNSGSTNGVIVGAFLGTSFSLRAPDEVRARLRELMKPADALERAADLAVVVERRQVGWSATIRTLASGDSLSVPLPEICEVLPAVVSLLNHAILSRCSQLSIHSGAVARGVQVVAFPGTSGAGKSTLTAACLQAGFSYVSDEALCLTGSDEMAAAVRVIPYPRPLSLSAWSQQALGLENHDAHDHDCRAAADEALYQCSDFGAVPATGTLVLGDVLLLNRRPGHVAMRPASTGAAVHALLKQAFNHFRDPVAALSTATRAAMDARAWHVDYEDPRELAYELAALPASSPTAAR